MNAARSTPEFETIKKSPVSHPLFGFNHRRILVIDDDHDTAEAIRFVIESYSPNTVCTTVSDPYEALLALSDEEFHFVLVDHRIPGLSGLQILSQVDKQICEDPLIVESGRYQNPVPVVLMSGSPIPALGAKKLKNFVLVQSLQKKDLPMFLSNNFAN